MGRDSSVGTATRFRLEGPGIESRWGVSIFKSVQTGPAAHSAPYTGDIGSFLGVKQPGPDVDKLTTSNAEVKERVELYLYFPSGPSWRVLGGILPLPLTCLHK
jgi:hypothetical protein